MRSKESRRISVRRSASGAGLEPVLSQLGQDERVDRGPNPCSNAVPGASGRSSGSKAHHRWPSNRRSESVSPAGQAAPVSIHCRIGGDFLLERAAFPSGHGGFVAGDHLEQEALGDLPRHNRRPTVARP